MLKIIRIAAYIRRDNSRYVHFSSNSFNLFLNLFWTLLTKSPIWLFRWLESTLNFLKDKGNIESLTYGTDAEPAFENGFDETCPIESELRFLSLSGHFYKKLLVCAWKKFNPGKWLELQPVSDEIIAGTSISAATFSNFFWTYGERCLLNLPYDFSDALKALWIF